jgi:hypothetical protein
MIKGQERISSFNKFQKAEFSEEIEKQGPFSGGGRYNEFKGI